MRTTTIASRIVKTVIGMVFAASAVAGTTDIATGPLVIATSTSVLPNLLVVMDDSGSMDWDYMPDVGGNAIFSKNKFGYASPQCNGVYYNPTITYLPPPKADGSGNYDNASYSSAWMDGYDSTSGKADLGSKFALELYQSNGVPSSGTAGYYYMYLGAQIKAVQKNYYSSSSTFYRECNMVATATPSATIAFTLPKDKNNNSIPGSISVSNIKVNGVDLMSGSYSNNNATGADAASGIASKISAAGYSATASGSVVTITGPDSVAMQPLVITMTTATGWSVATMPFSPFKKVVVSSSSGPQGKDERTNFANWFSYYRTRVNMMKSGMGLAFQPIDDHYRVGFATMNNNGGNMFVNIDNFTSGPTGQKAAFYNKLYAVNPGNSTPLLAALSRAGQVYANKVAKVNGVDVKDPVQYSCQKNVTLLSTDGFWNNNTNYDLSNGPVGNTDNGMPRPYTDGSSATVTVVTPTTTDVVTTTPRTVTDVTTRTDKLTFNRQRSKVDTYRKTVTTADGSSCSGSKVKLVTSTYLGDLTTTESTPYSSTQNYTTTTVTNYQDSSTVTTTQNHTVVMTNGVVSSDIISPPSTGSPVTATVQIGNPTVNDVKTGSTAPAPGTATTSTTPASGLSKDIDYNKPESSTTSATCTSNPTYPSTNPSYAQVSATPASYGAYTDVNANTVTGNATSSAGYPSTSTGAVSTGTIGPNIGSPVTTYTNATDPTTNTLADVAMYYYMTDLRNTTLKNCTGALGGNVDVCNNNVSAGSVDTASWQHMTTFTLGLGAPGRMTFSPTYPTDTSGDYFNVKNGTGSCSWVAAGQPCNWPTPNVSGTPENIDDLWHAAVNGRGTYFSATDPRSLGVGLSNALASVGSKLGASAAATISNPNISASDNSVFSSTFVSGDWYGELQRKHIALDTGKIVKTSDEDWTVQAQLDLKPVASRTIYTYDATAGNHLKLFTPANLTAEMAYFTLPNIAPLSQFCASGSICLPLTSQVAASGNPLIDYIRGDKSNEGGALDTDKYYRARLHTLGDIVNSEATYVKRSLHQYVDSGYKAYITANEGRAGVVYVGANDGMLHAFDALTGAEKWAYVPSFVLPNLYKLADKSYSAQHQYYVDGSPVAEDVYFGKAWHTILVGGLNAGGRGYYAIDVTDPANPSVLWEFSDVNLGYTFGNPKITKQADGTWVVVVASGYNNVSPGDGQGRLWVLNAQTGAVLRNMATGVGDSTTPSGLAHISAWADNPSTNNTTLRLYGGDLLGNVWRFDMAGTTAPVKLATLKDSNGNPQPITSKPELGQVDLYTMVFVGTGKYLGASDLTTTQVQSFYAIKDTLGTTGVGNPRDMTNATTKFVQQTLTVVNCPAGAPAGICTAGQKVRTGTSNTVDLSKNNGWFIDLPETGERDNTDPTLSLGTIGFVTNIPKPDACSSGGTSYRYFLDYRSGAPINTAGGVVGAFLDNAISTGEEDVGMNNGLYTATTQANGGERLDEKPYTKSSNTTRRVTWREVPTDK